MISVQPAQEALPFRFAIVVIVLGLVHGVAVARRPLIIDQAHFVRISTGHGQYLALHRTGLSQVVGAEEGFLG